MATLYKDLGNTREKIIDDEAVVQSSSSSLWSYGGWPTTQYTSGTATVAASATDNVEIYEITDARMYNYHVFENFASTDPVDVYVSVDGLTYAAAALSVRLQNDVTTGGGIDVIDIPVANIGVLEGKFYSIKVLRKGTTNEAQNIRYAHSVK